VDKTVFILISLSLVLFYFILFFVCSGTGIGVKLEVINYEKILLRLNPCNLVLRHGLTLVFVVTHKDGRIER